MLIYFRKILIKIYFQFLGESENRNKLCHNIFKVYINVYRLDISSFMYALAGPRIGE